MHFVYDVDFVFGRKRRESHVSFQLPNFVNAVVGGSVNLYYVEAFPRSYREAVSALAARLGSDGR